VRGKRKPPLAMMSARCEQKKRKKSRWRSLVVVRLSRFGGGVARREVSTATTPKQLEILLASHRCKCDGKAERITLLCFRWVGGVKSDQPSRWSVALLADLGLRAELKVCLIPVSQCL
jgi:hypothetical protein